MFCAAAACFRRSLRNMICRSRVSVCNPLLIARCFLWWTLLCGRSSFLICSSACFVSLIKVHDELEEKVEFAVVDFERLLEFFSFSTSPALKPTSLVFSPLSSHLLSLAVSRVKSFPITYRGISCTWTARWGPFLFLTSCFSLSYFSGYCTFITAQIKRPSVHLLQFFVLLKFCWMQMVSLKIAVHSKHF